MCQQTHTLAIGHVCTCWLIPIKRTALIFKHLFQIVLHPYLFKQLPFVCLFKTDILLKVDVQLFSSPLALSWFLITFSSASLGWIFSTLFQPSTLNLLHGRCEGCEDIAHSSVVFNLVMWPWHSFFLSSYIYDPELFSVKSVVHLMSSCYLGRPTFLSVHD